MLLDQLVALGVAMVGNVCNSGSEAGGGVSC
jgi:hypothetical protein